MKIRRRMVLGPVVALAALVAITGGTAMAAPGDPRPHSQVVEKAAGELGITPEALTGAITRARAAVKAASGDRRPQSQVVEKAAGELGIAPEALTGAITRARAAVGQERISAKLAAAVEKGKITQQESDAIQAWLKGRPAATSKLGIGDVGTGKERRHGHGRGGFKGHGKHRMPPFEQPAKPSPTP
ncbi:MAG: hypothetical protein FJ314_03145 [SAR202 cluster bacterium]|nr:hypothetical protein [SAR202 cluster bacterium]